MINVNISKALKHTNIIIIAHLNNAIELNKLLIVLGGDCFIKRTVLQLGQQTLISQAFSHCKKHSL
jgi:hypothetical protein